MKLVDTRDPRTVMTLDQDVSRNCLVQCKDQTVDGYRLKDGKLECVCKK